MKNTNKWVLGVICVFIGLGGLIYNYQKLSDRIETPTDESKGFAEEHTRWVEVYTFKGNGMKKSSVFELMGSEARLKYKYKGEGGVGMGMFAVYVVDEGKDIMKTGGFPDVMTQAESEESEGAIQKNAGRYYLNVNAVGNWTVTVQERR